MRLRLMWSPAIFCWALLAVLLIVTQAAKAGVTYEAGVGAQSPDKGKQAMAFLPNELWILENDSITWTSHASEGHTVTFLKQNSGGAPIASTRPSNANGCNVAGGQGGATVATASGLPLTLTAGATPCLNSGRFSEESDFSWTVQFPNAGNFKFVCLVHKDQTGAVHVLVNNQANQSLLHTQRYYDDLAASEARTMVNADANAGRQNDYNPGDGNYVTIDPGDLLATGGGKYYLAVMRFKPESINVRVGDTVEWTNFSAAEPHNVVVRAPINFTTTPPTNPANGSGTGPVAPDGARTGTLPNTACAAGTQSCLNSATFGAANQDQTNQVPLAVTRFRVTFTEAGTYDYFCSLHEELGMVGRVVVR